MRREWAQALFPFHHMPLARYLSPLVQYHSRLGYELALFDLTCVLFNTQSKHQLFLEFEQVPSTRYRFNSYIGSLNCDGAFDIKPQLIAVNTEVHSRPNYSNTKHPVMSHDDTDTDSTANSAPDLQILGDEVTLQPSGFVEPSKKIPEGKEEALMDKFASFRSEPLQ